MKGSRRPNVQCSNNSLCSLRSAQIEQCKTAFTEADTNHDGVLSRSELCAICGWAEDDVEVSDFLKEFDVNEDGVIDFEEFCNIMANALLRDEQAAEEANGSLEADL